MPATAPGVVENSLRTCAPVAHGAEYHLTNPRKLFVLLLLLERIDVVYN